MIQEKCPFTVVQSKTKDFLTKSNKGGVFTRAGLEGNKDCATRARRAIVKMKPPPEELKTALSKKLIMHERTV
jgi:hypothetical protein